MKTYWKTQLGKIAGSQYSWNSCQKRGMWGHNIEKIYFLKLRRSVWKTNSTGGWFPMGLTNFEEAGLRRMLFQGSIKAISSWNLFWPAFAINPSYWSKVAELEVCKCIYEREILESQFDWPAFNLHKSMPVIKGTHLFDETVQQGNSTTSFLLITAIESFSIKDLFKSGVIGT